MTPFLRRELSRVAALSILALVLPLAACSDDSTAPEDRIVAGVNLTELFAPPTASEQQAVLSEWAGRDPQLAGVQTEGSVSMTLDGVPGTLQVVSHEVDGLRHVGGVIAPDGAEPGSLPVLVYGHGGDGGTSESELRFIVLAMGELADDVVLVAPSFRDETFTFGDQVLTSEGPASPWDRDVDDALSLLRVAAQVAPAADTSRVGVLGFSRGAAVGMLMAVRDPIVDRVVAFFGPTDFFSPWVQDVTEEALLGMPRDLPGLDVLNERFLEPLGTGAVTIQDVRPELVRRSAVLFADRLPLIQIHHGTADDIVPVDQSVAMADVLDALRGSDDSWEVLLYEGGVHDPLSLQGSVTRAREFLGPLVGGGAGAAGR